MAQTIKLKRSATPSAIPSTASLSLGEVAINTYDGKMFIKKDDGTEAVVEIGSGGGGVSSFADNAKLTFGDSADLEIYHDGSNSYIADNGTGNLVLKGTNLTVESSTGENYFVALANADTRLYYDNAQKLATTSTGIDVTGTATMDGLTVDGNGEISSARPILDLMCTNATDENTRIDVNLGNLRLRTLNDAKTTAKERVSIDNATGDISFYEDTGTTPKLTWDASAESLNFADNGKAIFGAGSDLQIYHDGSNSIIYEGGTGDLQLRGNGGSTTIMNGGGTETLANFGNNGAVTLYHDNAIKLATTSTGIDITGTVTADGLTVNADALINSVTVGRGAGDVSTNTTVGNLALAANTSGANNVANGYVALRQNTTGSSNVATGSLALYKNTTGNSNVATGYQALYDNTDGDNNLATGYAALSNNTTGSNNVATGYIALLSNTTGSNNTALGRSAGNSLTTGSNNTVIGYNADASSATVSNETTIGNTSVTSTRIFGDISFYEDTGTTPKFFWDASAESLGIGTTSPTHSLTIENSGTQQIKINNTTSNTEVRLASSSTGVAFLWTQTNDPFLFGVNGTERFRIDSSGNLLVGASSVGPYGPNKLLVSGSNVTAGYGGNLAVYTNNAVGAGIGGYISLGGVYSGSTQYEFGGIKGQKENATAGNAQGRLAFYTTNISNSTVERMRIDSSGNVGIGTTSPSYKLDTYGAVASRGSGLGNAAFVLQEQGNSPWHLMQFTGGSFSINYNGTSSANSTLAIDSSGNVGIGTSSPAAFTGFTANRKTLQIVNTTSGNGQLRLGTDAGLMVDHNGGGTTVSTIRNLYGATNAAAALALQSGIITLGTGTSYTERMRIDASGNLLVGKTASSFTTAGVELAQGGTAGKVQIQRSSSPLTLVNLTDDGSILNFYKGTTAVGSIGTSASSIYIGGTSNGAIYFNGITDIRPWNTSTQSNLDNSMDLGNSGARFKDLYLSGIVTASGGTSTNWNTAYGWGDHSTQSYATQSYVGTAISNLVDSAPATLDTLNELAAALGDDPNFATTVTNSIAGKVSKSGDTITSGTNTGLTINHDTFGNGLIIHRNSGTTAPSITFKNNATQAGILYATTTDGALRWRNGTSVNAHQVFHDGYHPNADTWTTARTISLTGAVTGSVSMNGSGNVSIATTATADPTLTLAGDATGSATFTNLGNATLTVAVADDSHNHIISNVDGLQTALDSKLNLTGGTLTGTLNGTSATFTSDDGLTILTSTNGTGAEIKFSDHSSGGYTQEGTVGFYHSDTLSYGSGSAFVLSSTESTTTILADGKLMYGEGVYLKPATGTGAGTRKDNNWDTAYTYSQVGHLPLTGGTLTGTLNGTAADFSGNVDANSITTGVSQTRGKISVWSTSTYGIGMGTGYTFGGIANDYAMTFQMNNANNRGFWWGDDSHTNAQGAMSLTTNGKLTVAHSARIGFGETDTTIPGSTHALEVNGSFAATTKSFVIDHPTKPNMKLRHGSLEGPENGVYVRGRLKDNNVIELPDYWTGLVDEDTITVNLTAIGRGQDLWVEDVAENKVTVGGENINCFYTVFAERKDVERFEVEYEA